MVQRHNSPAPLRFGSFGSSCLCFASLRPTGGPQNQKREGRSGALPLPFLPSLPLFGCSCSLGGSSAAASAPTGHNKGGRLLFAASLRASACPVSKAATECRTQQRRAACRLPAPVLLCCSAPVASSVPVGCLLCGGCLLFGSVGPFFGPSCALLCSACRSAPLGGFSRLLWPLPAFALLFLHKGGKKAALCSCLPLYLKRYAGGSVLLLPLCSCPKEGRPFGLCCGLSCLRCLPSLRLCLRLSLRGLLCSASFLASSPAFLAALKRAARLCLLCLLFGSLPASVCLRACLCCRCLRLCSSPLLRPSLCPSAPSLRLCPVLQEEGRAALIGCRLCPVCLRYAFACAAAFL